MCFIYLPNITMPKITMNRITKDSDTRRMDEVYNFEKPRNPDGRQKPNEIIEPVKVEITETLSLTPKEQEILNQANELLETITYQ
jgi:hypothetical protein